MDGDIVFEAHALCINAVRDDGSELPIVKDVSFQVPRGSVVALIGESGSGKTTIALSALGYCKPGLQFAGGEARVLGRNLIGLSNEELRAIRGERVAYLAQSAAATFNPSLRINDQVTEAPVHHGAMTQEQADARALELYRTLELPEPERIGRRYPHQVSGGQLQRLMAATALCSNPDLMVLDEPTTALDVTTQIEVLKSFKKVIREQGAAAMYVTHDLAVVAQIADYIVVLYQGEMQEKGPVEVILGDPRHPYTRRLMEAVRPAPAAGLADDDTGDHVRDAPALHVRDVSAGYGKILNGRAQFPILAHINVAIERGHTVGIIGESGCGKSTLARVMAGLLPPARGDLLLDGNAVHGSYRRRTGNELRRVQLVYQMADTALNPKHRIGEILGRPLEKNLGLRGRAKEERIGQLLAMVDLRPEFAVRLPHELSGGQKQRVNLARALAAEPEVMLCDEVTSALDTIVGANVIDLLKRLRKDTGVSFVFISHDLSTVASFADAIVVLYAGRVAEQGPTDQVLSPPFHPYTRLLIASVPEMRVGWLEETMGKREALAGIARAVTITEVGCPFHDRCPVSIEGTCDRVDPPQRMGAHGHVIECHREIEELGA